MAGEKVYVLSNNETVLGVYMTVEDAKQAVANRLSYWYTELYRKENEFLHVGPAKYHITVHLIGARGKVDEHGNV